MTIAVDIDIAVEDPGWDTLGRDVAETLTERAAIAVLDRLLDSILPPDFAEPAPTLVVVLASDATIRDLNRDWRNKDKPTNVLSFPSGDLDGLDPEDADFPDRPPLHLGDVILAWETVKAEAEAGHRPIGHHLSHLVVHGVLHLLGYDHEVDAEAEEMEALEVLILSELGIPDPYAEAA